MSRVTDGDWTCSGPRATIRRCLTVGTAIDLGAVRKVKREELCPGCQAWVHCCKNCRFWDDGARACDEPAAEWVHDRERANFCDFFALAVEESSSTGARGDDDRPAGGRDAFESLFRK